MTKMNELIIYKVLTLVLSVKDNSILFTYERDFALITHTFLLTVFLIIKE